MNHFGNAFVPCGVVYYIDTYNAQSTTINFAYESQNWAYMKPQQMFSSPISTATTPWWTTTPVKECCTPGTTSVWSLILSRLNHKSKKETAPAQNCTEVKRFSFYGKQSPIKKWTYKDRLFPFRKRSMPLLVTWPLVSVM